MNFIKDTIKALKRDYGFSVVLYNIISTTLDLSTGEERELIQIRYVNKAILLPINSYFGGEPTYNLNDSVLYLDYCDFEIKVGTKVIYDNQCYDTIEVKTFEYSAGYILKIRAIDGDVFIAPGSATDTIIFNSEVTYEL